MYSAVETLVQSMVSKLSTIASIDTVERDRVEAIDKSEGIAAVVEIESETLTPYGGDFRAIAAKLRSEAVVNVHLLSWSSTWAKDLDALSCTVISKIMELYNSVDGLRLTKREWTAKAADSGFGVLSLTFSFESTCSANDLSKF